MFWRITKHLLVAVLVIVGLGFIGHTGIAEESEPQPISWTNGAEFDHQVEEYIPGDSLPLRTQTGAPCLQHTFPLLKSWLGLYTDKQLIVEDCAVPMKFGIVTDEYIEEYGETVAGKIVDSKHLTPVANSDTFVVAQNANAWSQYLKIYNNYNPTQRRYFNGVSGAPVYHLWGAPQPAYTVSDRSGRALYFLANTMRASANGQWLVAYIRNTGAARINLASGEVLPFGDWRGVNGLGISDDGRFVAEYINALKIVKIYDLDSCEPVPAVIKKSVVCESADLTSYLADNIGDINWISSLEFLDDSHLRIDVDYTDLDGVRKLSRIQISTTPGNFISQDYIALGDSFAAGEGDDADWYEIGTDEKDNKCHLSRRSYPYLIAGALSLENFHSVACSGAVIENIGGRTDKAAQHPEKPANNSMGSLLPGFKAQQEYVDVMGGTPNTITISIGGNDAGFADKLKECVLGPGTCKYAERGQDTTNVAIEIARLRTDLIKVYQQLIYTTGGQTKIYVIGYPQFVKGEGGSCGVNVHLNDSERKFVSEATHYMNQVIKSAADEAGVHYVDAESALENKNLCSIVDDAEMAVNGLTFGDDTRIPWYVGLVGGVKGVIATRLVGVGNESYHPNHNGHELMYRKIMDLTASNPLSYDVCPDGSDRVVCPYGDGLIPLPDVNYWGQKASDYINGLNTPTTLKVASPPTYRPIFVVPQSNTSSPAIKVDHLRPGSTLRVEIHSIPIMLGEFIVDDQGTVQENLELPDDITPGFHTLHIYGINTVGEPVEYYDHIFVPGPDGDIDNDGIFDAQDPCGFIEAANQDVDGDGIDDACDGYIGPAVEQQKPVNDTGDVVVASEKSDTSGAEVDPAQTSNTVSPTANTNNQAVTALQIAQNPQLQSSGNQPKVLGDNSVAVETQHSTSNIVGTVGDSTGSLHTLTLASGLLAVGLIGFVAAGIKHNKF